MASMWRRAMVYLGLQDDDELEYGGEYESYGEYADAADEPQSPRAGATPVARTPRPATARRRESGTVRTRPDTRTEYGADYGAPEPARPVRRPHRPATSRRACRRRGRASCAPIGPTTAARVHVVEPQGSTTPRRSATA